MSLFGGSTSKTSQSSTQLGAEGTGNYVVGEGASVTNSFPESVANFANNALDKAIGLAQSAVAGASASQATLGTVAVREKTPLTEWLPFAAAGAAALIALAYIWKGN